MVYVILSAVTTNRYMLLLNSVRHTPSVYKRLLWDLNNSNFELFRLKLGDIDLLNMINSTDSTNSTDECVHNFTETFMQLAKMYICNKTVIVRNRDKPWMHNEIRKQIRIRKRIHKTAKRLDTPEHWISYRQQRNKVTSLIRTAKLSYYSNLSSPPCRLGHRIYRLHPHAER